MRELRRLCVPADTAPRERQTRRRCRIARRWPLRLAGALDTTADGGDMCTDVCTMEVHPDIVDEPVPNVVTWLEDESEIGSPQGGPDGLDAE